MSTKSSKPIKFRIDIDPYGRDLICYFGPWKEYLKAMLDHVPKKIMVESGLIGHNPKLGLTFAPQNLGLSIWMPKAPDSIGEYGTLVHELMHVCHNVLDTAGMSLISETEEAYAYLIGHLYTEVVDQLAQMK